MDTGLTQLLWSPILHLLHGACGWDAIGSDVSEPEAFLRYVSRIQIVDPDLLIPAINRGAMTANAASHGTKI